MIFSVTFLCTVVEEYLKRGRSDLAYYVVKKLFNTKGLDWKCSEKWNGLNTNNNFKKSK